jgi:hypothetical protein
MDRAVSLAHILDEEYNGFRALCGEASPLVIVLRSLVDRFPSSHLCPECQERMAELRLQNAETPADKEGSLSLDQRTRL